MNRLAAITVFLGSSPGSDARYAAAATDVGQLLAERGQTLVYGGGDVGLMGVVADAALAAGGKVHGVIPQALADKEVAHDGLTQLDIVPSMHERKRRMFEAGDACVALPGGYGTVEEIFEVLTWAQLGFHGKPVGLLNVAGYWDGLLAFLDDAVTAQFVKPVHRDLLLVDDDPVALLDRFDAWRPAAVDKWLGRESEL